MKMGVHMFNRGPPEIYPNGDDVRTLGLGVVNAGVDLAEANHNGILVEEIPQDIVHTQNIKRSGTTSPYETITEYNMKHTNSVGLLSTCFRNDGALPTTTLEGGTLSHSHLLLVLRCYITGASWKYEGDGSRTRTVPPTFVYPCDADGCLDKAAVAAKQDAFQELVSAGLDMEWLSWKIYIEEPSACTAISVAMNKANAHALKATELAALATLTGEVTLAVNTAVAGEVCYSTIKNKVRSELGELVDEPEFQEMFDFVCKMGANKNTYLTGFILWTNRFVSSKFRRLRLQACATLNKANMGPHTKIAILKRCLRKPPAYGYCPAPESLWLQVNIEGHIADLENLLRYFHITCNAAVNDQEDPVKFLGNVDVSAADAFASIPGGGTGDYKKRREKMIRGVLPFVKELWGGDGTPDTRRKLPEIPHSWMAFDAASREEISESSVPTVQPPAPKLQPVVIEHSETTGEAMRCEQTRSGGVSSTTPQTIALPWKEWRSDKAERVAYQEGSAMDAARLVLALVHETSPCGELPIDVVIDGKTKTRQVMVTSDIGTSKIELPPCIPKLMRFIKDCVHPHRVEIVVELKGASKDTIIATYKFHVVPEWVAPEEVTSADPAVNVELASSGLRAWKWSGKETMHPFWAVRRLSADDLAKKATGCEFNCVLEMRSYPVAVLGLNDGATCSNTWVVSIPCIVNDRHVPAQTELFLEVGAVKKAVAKKRTWKDDAAKADKDTATSKLKKIKPNKAATEEI